jgi:hypothetical protein
MEARRAHSLETKEGLRPCYPYLMNEWVCSAIHFTGHVLIFVSTLLFLLLTNEHHGESRRDDFRDGLGYTVNGDLPC